MNINRIKPPNSIASGAYFPAVEVESKGFNQLFVSGQGTKDAHTGARNLGNIKDQTKAVMENLKTVINGCGYKMNDIVKTTIFLIDMNDFDEVNIIYKEYFAPDKYPARATVGVKELPGGQALEIEAIAFKNNS